MRRLLRLPIQRPKWLDPSRPGGGDLFFSKVDLTAGWNAQPQLRLLGEPDRSIGAR